MNTNISTRETPKNGDFHPDFTPKCAQMSPKCSLAPTQCAVKAALTRPKTRFSSSVKPQNHTLSTPRFEQPHGPLQPIAKAIPNAGKLEIPIALVGTPRSNRRNLIRYSSRQTMSAPLPRHDTLPLGVFIYSLEGRHKPTTAATTIASCVINSQKPYILWTLHRYPTTLLTACKNTAQRCQLPSSNSWLRTDSDLCNGPTAKLRKCVFPASSGAIRDEQSTPNRRDSETQYLGHRRVPLPVQTCRPRCLLGTTDQHSQRTASRTHRTLHHLIRHAG